MRTIKVVVLLVQQLQHGFTKNAKVSPNLTVAHNVITKLAIRTLIQISRRRVNAMSGTLFQRDGRQNGTPNNGPSPTSCLEVHGSVVLRLLV